MAGRTSGKPTSSPTVNTIRLPGVRTRIFDIDGHRHQRWLPIGGCISVGFGERNNPDVHLSAIGDLDVHGLLPFIVRCLRR